MEVKAIPDGYHSMTPYLIVEGGAKAITFYKQAFGATELLCMEMPDGEIGHAEIKIGNSIIMLSGSSCGEIPVRDPKSLGGSSVGLHLYVEDVDALFSQAVLAGAKVVKPVEDKFYGDRSGTLEDPFGHFWFLSTHKEDLTPEELSKRADALFKQGNP